MKRTSLIAVLGAAALTTCLLSGAHAAGNPDAKGIVVRYSQEMLENRDDAARVYEKLKRASRKVCGLGAGHLTVPERTVANRCYQLTLADVVGKIDRPLLTSVYVADRRIVG